MASTSSRMLALLSGRRHHCLSAVVAIAADGTVAPPDGPGLGVEPDLDALEQWRVA